MYLLLNIFEINNVILKVNLLIKIIENEFSKRF